jgi:hypothetical protein
MAILMAQFQIISDHIDEIISNIVRHQKRRGKAMMYVARHQDIAPRCDKGVSAKRKAATPKAGVLRRIVDAIFESRERQTDREIARILDRSGGRLTDDVEREMTLRLSPQNWSAPE